MSKVNNKKITLGIIIDTDFKIPPVTGVTYRLYYLSKQLSDNGVNVKLFICNRNIKTKKDEKLLYEESALEFHILPENIFYSPEKLKAIIKKNYINILQFEDSVSVLRYKKIFQDLKISVCLEMHDVESSLKEMLNYCNDDIKKTNIISSYACKLADKVICMTPLDYSELIHKIGVSKNKLAVIPNPINLKEFKYFSHDNESGNILFIGNMFYQPNQNAVISIIKKVAPKVLKLNPNVCFYFVGMVPKKLKRFENEKIIFTGKIKNINCYLKKSVIALCPVYEGSGMKVKILNYCAAGIPVITTTIGSSGYEKIKSLIIENNISNYSKLIIDILCNKKQILKIGKQNRQYIEKYYNVESVSKKITKIYNFILKNKTNTIKNNFNNVKIPLPLWLEEKRVNAITNKNYYIIKNGKTILKKKLA